MTTAGEPAPPEDTLLGVASPLPERTDNSPRPNDGDQPDDDAQTPGSERTDLV